MNKSISILWFAVLVFIPNNFPQNYSGSGVLLYSQTDIASNQVSIPSYYYNSSDWTQIADNFTAGSDWEIDQIGIVGTDVSNSYLGINIYIYSNNNGLPDTLVYYAGTQPYTISFITYDIWYITINLVVPANLDPGDYFISIQSFGGPNLYWNQVNGAYGNIAKYRWVGNTFWVPVTNLSTSYTDMYFELWGTTTIPVELTSFLAVVSDDNVELSWITSTETNNQGFEILRSAQNDSEIWERIGFVDGHGTTTETQVYSFIDKNLITGKYNYRLKQIDYDGTFEYSNVIEVEVTFPSTFSLEQNYPNPFNPSTKIRYTIPNVIASETKQSQFVNLKIYDVLGNEVATLVNEHRRSGSYEVEFDASNLPSGTYFYQLRTGSFVETKKMVVLK